jgi:acyl-CoA thioester hydrolase
MPPFRHRLRARYSECDPQGVVFNANYLTWFDIAITELWREAIGPYEEAMSRLGVDLVVAEATVRYRAGVRFDEEVELVVSPKHLGNTSMTTAIAVGSLDHGRVAAEGELRHVFVDHGSTEKAPIPDEVRDALAPYGDGTPGDGGQAASGSPMMSP